MDEVSRLFLTGWKDCNSVMTQATYGPYKLTDPQHLELSRLMCVMILIGWRDRHPTKGQTVNQPVQNI